MTKLDGIKAKIAITEEKLKEAEEAANSVDNSHFRSLLLDQQNTLNLLLSEAGDFSLIPYFGCIVVIVFSSCISFHRCYVDSW